MSVSPQKMIETVEAYVAAFETGDAEAVARLYAADAVVRDPVDAKPVVGRDAIAAFRATVDDIATGRRAGPGEGWREFRSYQAGIQDWLQHHPDLTTEVLARVGGGRGGPAAPAPPSGELLRALAEIEAMKNSPFWRLRALVIRLLRGARLRHRG